jgi:protein dithiol oxidoreductase (disulfide-forming)
MLKQIFTGFAILALAASSFVAIAADPQPNVNYGVLAQPQPVDSDGRVEVLEFFWYNCPHCYALEPLIEPWAKKLPKDTQFKRVPAIFNEQWAMAGRAYYALEATGDLERLHRPLFDAIHNNGLRITDEKAVAEWIGKQGGDAAKFSAAYRSFAVESKLKRALQLTQAYQFDGVPTLAVQGKYVVIAGKHGGNQAEMLATVDYLIGQARKDIKPAAKK